MRTVKFEDNYDITLGNTNYTVNSISDIFQKVIERKVCVVNSENGKVTEFYWNPKEIYGTNTIYTGNGINGIQ